jgi:tetraacyldisaccharide 4'-kinase
MGRSLAVDDRAGPLPRVLAPLAWLCARGYGAAVAWRNVRFDRGIGVETLECEGRRVPVVSVGNLTAGGTGKSPVVAWIARELAALGAQPVIALRGYRAFRAADGTMRSDEADEYARSAPDARVVVGAARRAEVARLLASDESGAWRDRAVVVLDDGFQHRRLARDLDVVLVDATRPGLDGDLLPNGWLREPARAIRRAQFVLLAKSGESSQRAHAESLVRAARGRGADAACVHAWRSLEVLAQDGTARNEPPGWLRGRSVVVACGLGNPGQFESMVEEAGATIAARVRAADHRAIDVGAVERAIRAAGSADAVVVSRKDAVKLDAWRPRAMLVVPELVVSFDAEGASALRSALAELVQVGARARVVVNARDARA